MIKNDLKDISKSDFRLEPSELVDESVDSPMEGGFTNVLMG